MAWLSSIFRWIVGATAGKISRLCSYGLYRRCLCFCVTPLLVAVAITAISRREALPVSQPTLSQQISRSRHAARAGCSTLGRPRPARFALPERPPCFEGPQITHLHANLYRQETPHASRKNRFRTARSCLGADADANLFTSCQS